MNLLPGHYYELTVVQLQNDDILLEHSIKLPRNTASSHLHAGDKVSVFLYHNIEGELTATLLKPYAQVGDFATLKVLSITTAGAFLDWGLPKDLFVPRSFHEDDLKKGDRCLVKIVIDPTNGKVIGKEKLEDELSNEVLTVKEKEEVELIVYKNTPLGYQVIVNNKHLGLVHNNEIFKDIYAGDLLTGFIKKIKPDNKLDVVIGKPGHTRVETETDSIITRLKLANGFLPYHDKSPAEEIYSVFGMSKKTFKMTIGHLYRRKLITIEQDGIRLNTKK